MSTAARPENVAKRFEQAIGQSVDVTVRQIDTERIYVVTVPAGTMQSALQLSPIIEAELADESESVIVSVRAAQNEPASVSGPVRTLDDQRVENLVQLLASRSRTSELQPSLSYIPNNTGNMAQIIGTRHNLIFGRRGAGKTALLVEARRRLDADHQITVWSNTQPLRAEGIEHTFLYLAKDLIERLLSEGTLRGHEETQFYADLGDISSRIESLLNARHSADGVVRSIVPAIHRVVKRAIMSLGAQVYFFIDDFYYLPRSSQVDVLDLLHGSTRDADVWLKIASIRHLSRWYRSDPPTGLQTGQDVNIIDLDLNLQTPAAAEQFLTKLLESYCGHVGITTVGNIIARQAIDRLAFASGGVPRDFLTLAASAVTKARTRSSGRTVGITDVNQAAGDAAKSKIGELEDDLASNAGYSSQTIQALGRVREFCLDEKGYTYFRIDFRDKERNTDEYAIISRLLDARLVHLIDPSVSDMHHAGERSECYTLDLSQYSGYRLKQNIRVLDFSAGQLVAKRTRRRTTADEDVVSNSGTVVGKTARQVLQILRVAPVLELTSFRDLVNVQDSVITDIEKTLRGQGSKTIDELVIAVNLPYYEVSSALRTLEEQKRIRQISADGIPAFVLVR